MEQETRPKRTPIVAWTLSQAARQARSGRRNAWIGPAGALLVLATFFYFLM